MRFNNLVQSIVITSFRLLQEISKSSCEQTLNSTADQTPDEEEEELIFEDWTSDEKDKLLHLNAKVFQVNFPLYVAYKQLNISKNDELTSREMRTLSNFCDLGDYEAPVYLMRRIIYFLDLDGFTLFSRCFETGNLSLLAAHALISMIQNIKSFFMPTTVGLKLRTLRSNVINYMCKIPDEDLRVANNRSIFETIWTAVRDSGFNVSHDLEGLRVVLKFFTSSTLTMRLAALSQIGTYISNYDAQVNSCSMCLLLLLVCLHLTKF